MNWFQKKKKPKPKKRQMGLFSTDWIPEVSKSQLAKRLEVTFQKSVANFVPDTKGAKFAMDEQYNDLTSVKVANMRAQGIPEAQINYYAGQGFIGWQTCAMLSQNWLIDKACTMPAKDASRNGYEITVGDGQEVAPEVLEYMRKQDKKFKVNKNCVEFIRMGRIFGIRIAMFEVKSSDPLYYEKPFNPDGITPGSYQGISQIDPYWVAPLLDMEASANPAAKDFYEPTWWLINSKRIHRSHLIIMRTCELPDILKPTYIYGGVPLPQRIAERVYAAERTANEAPMLAMTKRLINYKMDLTQAAANQEVFERKLEYFTQTMNNYGLKITGGDEEIQQFDTSLSDLDVVIMTQYQIVAAVAEVPATKLLGTSPKGFNATGEFEESSYHEFLESIQEHDLTDLVDRHHICLIRSHVAPKFNIPVFSTELSWNPLDAETASEQAETNLKKAQADAIYSDKGALDGVDIRNRLIIDKESGYNGLEPITEALNAGQEIEMQNVLDSFVNGENAPVKSSEVKNSEVKSG